MKDGTYIIVFAGIEADGSHVETNIVGKFELYEDKVQNASVTLGMMTPKLEDILRIYGNSPYYKIKPEII